MGLPKTSLFNCSLLLACTLVALAAASNPYGIIPKPPTYQSPRLRYWFSGGWIDPGEVAAEVQAAAAAGFGGVEIADVRDSIDVPMDTALYGWAQPRWNTGVLSAYETAIKNGIHVDYTIGPQWPTGVPGYTPDSPETEKELVHGVVLVAAGANYSGQLPAPSVKPSGVSTANPYVNATLNLVACLAARTNETTVKQSKLAFNSSSVLDLTSNVTQNVIQWQAPSNSAYLLVAIYGRGTGQIQRQFDGNPNAPNLTDPSPAYVVDHFSAAGVQASINYWNEHILSDELRPLILQSEGSLFEDSLEIEFHQYWTNNFIKEFATRRGYDLTPYLLYVVKDTNTFVGDADAAMRVNYDFNTTVVDLYCDYRATGLKNFANSIGLRFRAQTEYYTIDWSRASATVDIPEGDFSTPVDGFRIQAAGRDVAGKTRILSEEIGAISNDAYGTTFKTHLTNINGAFSLGVNQVVLHGYPYRDSPDSRWPGFHAFTPRLDGTTIGYSEAWGTRQPQWIFANNVSSYLARAQYIQQMGLASVDIAILDKCWDISEGLWSDYGLAKAGFSYQFPSSPLLLEYNATVDTGRLVPNGPRYKAFIINDMPSLNLDIARAIYSWAKAGLPVIVVGNPPNATQSFSETIAADNLQLRQIIASILDLDTSSRVANQSAATNALQALGVKPSITYKAAASGALTALKRRMSDGDSIFWLYSSGTDSYTVSLEASGWPYRMDLWTGVVTPIGAFNVANGYVTFNISIANGAAESIYVGNTPPFGAQRSCKYVTAVSSGAEVIVDETNNLLVRTTTSGTYIVTKPSGNVSTVSFSGIPAAVTIKAWNLTVEDWSPVNPNATGVGSSNTTKTVLPTVTLSSLAGWPSIAALGSASGVGVYRAQFAVPPQNASTGVYLTLSSIMGTWGVKINDQVVDGCDLFVSRPLDLSPYVHEGQNDIEITVATPLWNKMRSIWSFYASTSPLEVGMIGSPVVSYYQQQNL